MDMRGSKPAELSDEQREWLREHRERQALANAEARDRRRQEDERRQAEIEQAEIAQRKAEHQKALRDRVRAMSDRLASESDNRLNEIATTTRRAELFLLQMISDAQRRARQANINALIDEIILMNNPPPEPIPVRIIDEDY